MSEQALTRNAGDPKQVKHAGRKERQRAELLRAALRFTLTDPAGRLVLWEILERAGIYRSIWSPNAEIHYRAGRQDFGHEIMALILETDEALYLTMETEARARARKERTETEAINTPSNEEQRNG